MHIFLAALSAVALATPIARENAHPGTSEWASLAPPSPAIEGYASSVSVAPGERLDVHVSTAPAARYRVEVYRLGWYGGAGGRLLTCIPSCTGDEQGVEQQQPGPPPQDPHSPPIRAGWPVTES